MAEEWFNVTIPEHHFGHLLRVALHRDVQIKNVHLEPNSAITDDLKVADAWTDTKRYTASLIPSEALEAWIAEHVVGQWKIDGKLSGRLAKIGFTRHTDMMAFRLRWS